MSAGASRRGDLLVIHDFGNLIEVAIFAGGKEIARMPVDAFTALRKSQELIEAASRHLRNENHHD